MVLCREIALGGPAARGTIEISAKIPAYIAAAQREGKELYVSYYAFDHDEMKAHRAIYKTIKSFSGVFHLTSIILDIDLKTDNCDHLRRTLTAIRDLGMTTDMFQLWFSGTGFHIQIPNYFHFTPSPTLPATVRRTLTKLFPDADNIYDGARLIRAAYTINAKSGLYKIPVDLADYDLIMRGYDDPALMHIRDVATSPRGHTARTLPTEDHLDLSRHIVLEEEARPLSAVSARTTASDSTRFVTCMQTLFNRGAVKGRRHTDMLRLSSNWLRNGVPIDGVVLMLQRWAPDMSEYEIRRIVNSVQDRGYRYSCTDPVMMEFCDPMCIFFKGKGYGSDVLHAEDAERALSVLAKAEDDGRTLNLHDALPGFPEHTIRPGEVVIVWADTGMGKSALVQNICSRAKHLNILYLSLEMGAELVFRRFVQIQNIMSKKDVMDHYKLHDNTFSKGLEHIRIIHTPPTLSQIKRTVADIKADLVVVDVIDAIKTPGIINDQDSLKQIDLELRELAIQQKCIVIGIHHISKAAAVDMDGNRRTLHIHSGKGPSIIEQKADTVIALEPHPTLKGDVPPGIQIRKVSSMKTRDAEPFSTLMAFDPDTFTFTSFTPEE